MVKIDKTPLPDNTAIKNEDDYRKGTVFDLIVKDCRNKCYICEDGKPVGINVEHRVSHKGDTALKYDWNNLFLSCTHCNNTKGTAFDNIIDPVKVDPEKYIDLAISTTEDLREKVIVRKTVDTEYIDKTVQLLECVYNGDSTDIKKLECANLRNKIMQEINRFQLYINGYNEENSSGYHTIIAEEISRSSAFAAFKRKIIRDDPQIASHFTEALL